MSGSQPPDLTACNDCTPHTRATARTAHAPARALLAPCAALHVYGIPRAAASTRMRARVTPVARRIACDTRTRRALPAHLPCSLLRAAPHVTLPAHRATAAALRLRHRAGYLRRVPARHCAIAVLATRSHYFSASFTLTFHAFVPFHIPLPRCHRAAPTLHCSTPPTTVRGFLTVRPYPPIISGLHYNTAYAYAIMQPARLPTRLYSASSGCLARKPYRRGLDMVTSTCNGSPWRRPQLYSRPSAVHLPSPL